MSLSYRSHEDSVECGADRQGKGDAGVAERQGAAQADRHLRVGARVKQRHGFMRKPPKKRQKQNKKVAAKGFRNLSELRIISSLSRP